MVRDFNSKNSANRGKTTTRKVNKAKNTQKARPVKKASGVSKKAVRSPKKTVKKGNGIIARLFRTDRTPGEMDYTFLLLVGVLVIFGLVMLLSASTPTANVKVGKSYYFFLRQLMFVVAGSAIMMVCTRIDYRNLKQFTFPLVIISWILLWLVYAPYIGVEENGARRWINLIVMRFQPSELMKMSLILFFAALLEDKRADVQNVKYGLSIYMLCLIVAIIPLAPQHLSGTAVVCGIVLCMLIVAGANVPFIVGAGTVGGVLLVAVMALISPARMSRITSFFNPFTDMQGSGYQTAQSVYAIGSGGIFGKGLGESVQKYSYLPEPYNDFIFSVTCEELGLIGAVFIIALFMGLIIRGIKIAMECEDVFGTLTVVGIMSHVAIQTILNIAVATASIPNTGVSLPFFSYGGTAIMMLLVEMGIVLSVSRYSSKNK